jgi:hypothetical protein
MADWVGQMAFLLQPLADAIGLHVRAGETLHADDTPVPVLDPGRGRTKTGRLSVVVRDERSWGSPAPPAVYYQYAPDRKAERAEALLRRCRSYLHADAYAGFPGLYEPNPVTGTAPLTEVGCWAQNLRHSRRHESPRAHELLEGIAKLFQIEAGIKGRGAEERLAVRKEQSEPLLKALKTRFEETLGQISAKGSLAEAIRYTTSRWAAMTRFVADGRLEICNNAAARAMRPIAIGRHNWRFAGSDGGGDPLRNAVGSRHAQRRADQRRRL